jgi:peptidoglycan/xylan/chitin deacetylase (PgdA/CDA1 family)
MKIQSINLKCTQEQLRAFQNFAISQRIIKRIERKNIGSVIASINVKGLQRMEIMHAILIFCIFLCGCGAANKATKLNKAVLHVSCTKPYVTALTMDNNIPQEALDVLEKYNVTAAFFPNGNGIDNVTRDEALARGMILGNISYTHNNMRLSSEIQNQSELDMTDAALGFKTKYFRPPWGEYDQEVLDLAELNNKISIGWVSSADADDFIPIDGIVLLHPVEKLEALIVQTLESGRTFVSLDECVGQ